MLKEIKYPALNAKMKGMYVNNFNGEELNDLMSQTDIKNVISLLKTKFPSLELLTDNMGRKEIEQELYNIFIFDIIKIFKYLTPSDQKIVMQYISRYELTCIKNVFRNIYTERDSKTNLKNINNWTENIFKNIDGINEVNKTEDFVEIIKNEEYFKIFKEYVKDFENIPLEDLEVELDKYYFKRVYTLAQRTNKELLSMIGQEIDLLNFIWIYRSKHYFNYSKEMINSIIIPKMYKLTKKNINDLIDAESYDDMLAILKTTIYKKVFDDEKDLEHSKDVYLYKQYRTLFRTKLFNICTVFCMINLIDVEIKNLINVIEGVRYGISEQEIQKRMIS